MIANHIPFTEADKCKTLIRISEQMMGAINVDNPTDHDIAMLEKHITIIKINKAKLLILGESYESNKR